MKPAMKSAMKRTVKAAVMGIGRIVPAGKAGSRILAYHSVGRRDHEMNVQPTAFRDQVAWLADHAKLIPLRDAAAGMEGVAVTFDDGYLDNLTQAGPVLCEFKTPATVFVVPGRFGEWLGHDSQVEAARLMTGEQVRELEAMGVEIGAHTLTHPRLSHLDEAGQRREIGECARQLRELLGHPVDAFAYPFGTAADYDATSVRIVRESGFAHACSNRYGVNPPESFDRWALRRIWIDATDSLSTFRAKVDGRLDALRMLDTRAGVAVRRMVNWHPPGT